MNVRSPQNPDLFDFDFRSYPRGSAPLECMRIRLDEATLRDLEAGTTSFTIHFDKRFESGRGGGSGVTATLGETRYALHLEKVAEPTFLYCQSTEVKLSRSQTPIFTKYNPITMYNSNMRFMGKAECVASLGAEQKQLRIPLQKPSSLTNNNNNNNGITQKPFSPQQISPTNTQEQQQQRTKPIPLVQKPQSPPVKKEIAPMVERERSQSQSSTSLSLSLTIPLPSLPHNDEKENDDDNTENEVRQEKQEKQRGRTKEIQTKKGEIKKQKVSAVEEFDELEEELSLDELRQKLVVKRITSVKEFEILKSFYNKYQKVLRSSYSNINRLLPKIEDEKVRLEKMTSSLSSPVTSPPQSVTENIQKWRSMVKDYNTLYSILHDSRHLFKEFVVKYRKAESSSSSSSNSSNSGGQPHSKRQRMKK